MTDSDHRKYLHLESFTKIMVLDLKFVSKWSMDENKLIITESVEVLCTILSSFVDV